MSNTKEEKLGEYISQYLPARIKDLLPRHMSKERFFRVAMAAVRSPALRDCDQKTVLECLLRCSQVGLEPDGRMAHLIPFKQVCTLIFDYKGLVDIVRRSGEVGLIRGKTVHSKDDFDFSYGTGEHLTHIPYRPGPEDDPDPGPVVAAYSFVRFKEGMDDFDVMTVREIEAIRKRSKRSGLDGGKTDVPWVNDYDQMAAKTVFRRHSKWLPFSSEVREKIWSDDDHFIDIESEPVSNKRLPKKAKAEEFAPTGGFATDIITPPQDTSEAVMHGHNVEETADGRIVQTDNPPQGGLGGQLFG